MVTAPRLSGNNVVFTPTQGFNGLATVVYNIYDNGSGNLQDQSIIYIDVTNAPPTAVNDLPAPDSSSTPQVVNIGINDYDYDSSPLTWVIYSDGKFAASPTYISTMPSTITYTPVPGFTGNDTVYYYVAEPIAGCNLGARDSAYVVFKILNRVPNVQPDSKIVRPCQPTRIRLLDNDTDPEGNNFFISGISPLSNPAAGTIVNNNDGSVTFIPAPGFLGVVTFTYTVTDDGILPATSIPGLVTITVVAGVNNPPVAVNDVESISNMDAVIYSNVLGNDYDPDDNLLTNPVITVNPMHGTALVLPNGLIQYTPNPGFFGYDSLQYQVCDVVIDAGSCIGTPTLCATAKLYLEIVPPNIIVPINDENSTWVNTSVSGIIMHNDFDPEGHTPITFRGYKITNVLNTTGSHTVGGFDASGNPVANAGTLVINGDGTYVYTPQTNFKGVINVPYHIRDANPNTAYDSAYLRITVNPLPQVSNSIIANNDEHTSYGTAVSGNVFVNDRDPQVGHVFNLTSYKYESNGDGIKDGNGTVGSPVVIGGVTSSGKPVSNAGTLLLSANGNYSFTPATDFHGCVDVSYRICDNGTTVACAEAIMHINVIPDINGNGNEPPVAGDDFCYTTMNAATNESFIANDADPNGDTYSLNGVTIVPGGPKTSIGSVLATLKGGSVQFYADGTYFYVPPFGYVGPDLLTYSICDNTAVSPQPLCSNAMIHMLVGPAWSTLPATGLSAFAILQDKTATIKWETLSELNTDYFEIERSLDNLNFIPVGNRVIAAGNSANKNVYQQADNVSNFMQHPVLYYRVRLIDIDGKISYSNTVVVRLFQKTGVHIWPNPFRSFVIVSISTDRETTIEMKLNDINGSTIRTASHSVPKGISQITLGDLGLLPTGFYLLEIVDKKAGTTYQKVIKNH